MGKVIIELDQTADAGEVFECLAEALKAAVKDYEHAEAQLEKQAGEESKTSMESYYRDLSDRSRRRISILSRIVTEQA